MTLYQFYKFLLGKGVCCKYAKFNGIYEPIKRAIYAWSNHGFVLEWAKENGFAAEIDDFGRVMIH